MRKNEDLHLPYRFKEDLSRRGPSGDLAFDLHRAYGLHRGKINIECVNAGGQTAPVDLLAVNARDAWCVRSGVFNPQLHRLLQLAVLLCESADWHRKRRFVRLIAVLA